MTQNNSNVRSYELSAPVVNPATASIEVQVKQKKAPRKKVNRNMFTVVKAKAETLFDKIKWLGDDANGIKPERLFRKSVLKVVKETEGYNEAAFKKDLAMKMAILLDQGKFHRKCFESEWSLFEVAQKCAWAKETVFEQIRDLGIDKVPGFKTPDYLVYDYEELRHELKSQGFDFDYFRDDPYTAQFKELHPDVKAPML